MERTPSHLRLVDKQPVDLYDSFAEQHQADPDERAVLSEIGDWLGEHWPAIILGTALGLCLIALPAIVLVRL